VKDNVDVEPLAAITSPTASKEPVAVLSEGDKEPVAVLSEGDQDMVADGNEGAVSEVVISEDDAMSVGESDDGEDISDEFSVSGRSTSGGESILSRGSRKRRADASPERESGEPGACERGSLA